MNESFTTSLIAENGGGAGREAEKAAKPLKRVSLFRNCCCDTALVRYLSSGCRQQGCGIGVFPNARVLTLRHCPTDCNSRPSANRPGRRATNALVSGRSFATRSQRLSLWSQFRCQPPDSQPEVREPGRSG
jgi:hypothetical protein